MITHSSMSGRFFSLVLALSLFLKIRMIKSKVYFIHCKLLFISTWLMHYVIMAYQILRLKPIISFIKDSSFTSLSTSLSTFFVSKSMKSSMATSNTVFLGLRQPEI